MKRKARKYIKLKWLLWFGCGILLFFIFRRIEFEQFLYPLLLWVDGWGIWGAIAFVLIYILSTVLCVPGSILALGGGALFGVAWGAILIFIGGVIGAFAAFAMGKYFLTDWVKRKLATNSYLDAINKAIATEGWKAACLLHLSPLVPFNLLNYVLGTSAMKLKDFAIATMLGITPGVLLYSFCGSTLGNLTMAMMDMPERSYGKIHLIFSLVGLFITILLTVYLSKMAREQLNNMDLNND